MKFTHRVLTAVLSCAAGFAAAQEKPITLKFSYWVPAQHPIATKAIMPWAQAVTAASGGTIKFAYFPSAQLGKAEDHYDMVKDGIADMGWINPGLNPGRWPVAAALQIPLLASSPVGGSAAFSEWYGAYAAKEMAEVKVCFGHQIGPISFSSANKKVVMPEDLSGMKIRPSSAMEAIYLRQVGAAAVPGAYPETRELIARGVIDGTTGVYGSLISFGADKVTKHHLAIPFSMSSYVVAINKAKYDSLSARQKKAIDDNCNPEAAQRFATPLFEFENQGLQALRERKDGRDVTMPTPQILAAWKAKLPAVQAEWAKDVKSRGYDPEALMGQLRKTLAKHNALLTDN